MALREDALHLSAFHQCAQYNYLFLTQDLSVNWEQGQNEVEQGSGTR